MSYASRWLKAAFISAPLLAGTAQAEIDALAQSKNPPATRLANFCAPDNMKDRAGHTQCLRETTEQASTYAQSFHAALFTAVGLPEKVEHYYAMIEKWTPRLKAAPQDLVAVTTYDKNCGVKIADIMMDPDASLDFSHTTGYGLPKYCVESAQALAAKYNIPVNTQEGTRLSTHFKNIYSYYAAHPAIPPRKSTGPAPLGPWDEAQPATPRTLRLE